MGDRPRRQHFPRCMRLLTARDYERVFRRPHRSKDQAFTVLARASGRPLPRLGLAIARKHVKKAVERNRVKRLIRESFRRHQDLLRGLDVVVMVRGVMATRSSQSIFESLEGHWRRVSEACAQPARDPGRG